MPFHRTASCCMVRGGSRLHFSMCEFQPLGIRECSDGASEQNEIREIVFIVKWAIEIHSKSRFVNRMMCSERKFVILEIIFGHESVFDDNNRLWMVNNNELNCEKENNIDGVRSDAFNARTDKSRRHHQMSRKFVRSKHRSFLLCWFRIPCSIAERWPKRPARERMEKERARARPKLCKKGCSFNALGEHLNEFWAHCVCLWPFLGRNSSGLSGGK